MSRRTSARLSHAALITACVLWGASFYFGKVALREMAAHHVVVWRFVLALATLIPLAAYQQRTRSRRIAKQRTRASPIAPLLPAPPGVGLPDSAGAAAGPAAASPGIGYPAIPLRRDWPLFALNAALMVPIQFVMQFEGLDRTTASSAALIVGAFAPLLAVAALLIDKEHPDRSGWVAIATSTVGLTVLVGAPGEGRTLTGDLMVLTSLFAAVAMVLCTRRLVQRYDSLIVTIVSMGLGTLLLLPWSLFAGGAPPVGFGADAWAALLGLGVGCTAITFSLWNWGLRYVPAAQAGVYVNLEPLIGAVLGFLLLGDVITMGVIAGGALILASAVIVSWPKGRSSEYAEQER